VVNLVGPKNIYFYCIFTCPNCASYFLFLFENIPIESVHTVRVPKYCLISTMHLHEKFWSHGVVFVKQPKGSFFFFLQQHNSIPASGVKIESKNTSNEKFFNSGG
jgi:hypothetical protein